MSNNRYRQQRKKQIIFLSSIVVVLAAAAVALVIRFSGKEKYTGTYKESTSEDTIQYGGKRYRYNDHLSNYLFLGVDTRDNVESYNNISNAGQADAVFLISYDRAEETIQSILIPRDTMTQIEAFDPAGESLGKTEDHISIQYAMGDGKDKSCQLMKEAVSELLYGIPIQGYCSMNMDGIPVLTDIVGGVPITVPDDSLAEINPEFQKGAEVVITGENAEQFVRYRDINKSQSAIVRMNRQKVFLQAYAKKAQEVSNKDSSLIVRIYDGVQDYLVTNISNDIFAKMLAAFSGSSNMVTIPGEGTEGEIYDEYHVDEDQLYEMIIQTFYKEVQD